MSTRLQAAKNPQSPALGGGRYCADCDGGPFMPSFLKPQRDGRLLCGKCNDASKRKATRKAQHALFDDHRGQSTSLFDQMQNRVEGFMEGGKFHPIRASHDYNEFAAGDFDRARAPKRKKKPKPIGKRKKRARADRAKARRAERKAAGTLKPRRRKPVESLTLSQFVRRAGGMTASGKYAGEARRLGVKESRTTGLVNKRAGYEGKGGTWRKVAPEDAMDRANAIGYLDPQTGGAFSDVGRFLEAVEMDASGRRHVYHPGKDYDYSDNRHLNPRAKNPSKATLAKYAAYKREAKRAQLTPAPFDVWYSVEIDPWTLGAGDADKEDVVRAMTAHTKRRVRAIKGAIKRRNPGAVVSWNTSKVAGGYQFRVYAVEYGKPTTDLKTGVVGTRPKAVTQAKKWTRYFKALAARKENPSRVFKVKVTPEVARRLLATYVGPATKLMWSRIGKIARKMREGTYVALKPLRVNENGDLTDGRHRLEGVVQSGKTVKFEIVRAMRNPKGGALPLSWEEANRLGLVTRLGLTPPVTQPRAVTQTRARGGKSAAAATTNTPRSFKVTWYSTLRKRRTGFIRPIAAGSATEAKRQARAMIENEEPINLQAEPVTRNPKRVKRAVTGAKNPEASKFSNEHLEALRLAYASTPERLDPLSPTVKKMRRFLAKLSNAQLQQLIGARVRWLSQLSSTELRRRETKNPADLNPGCATQHKMFQGREATKTTPTLTAVENPANGWKLGDLAYVNVRLPNGAIWRIEGRRGAMLNASVGNKLYLSGLQHAAPEGLAEGKRRSYGEIVEIAYITPKAHINGGKKTEYWHPMGEETGERPRYAINSHGWPLIVGGAYSIDERGIIN